jgi:hypothetical protein
MWALSQRLNTLELRARRAAAPGRSCSPGSQRWTVHQHQLLRLLEPPVQARVPLLYELPHRQRKITHTVCQTALSALLWIREVKK